MKIAFKLLLILVLISCKSNSDSDKENQQGENVENSGDSTRLNQDQQSESFKRGKGIYNNFCATCHLANGQGIAGAFPPLDGSNWLTNKRTESISAVKHGLQGQISVNGKEYNSVMVDLGLTNQEVADVMNYINNSWSNSIKEPVTVEEVAEVEK